MSVDHARIRKKVSMHWLYLCDENKKNLTNVGQRFGQGIVSSNKAFR